MPRMPSALLAGSSPLTRGKLSRRQECTRMTRLIPAHAGKTSAFAPLLPQIAAHPRSRGENRRIKRVVIGVLGSSPLTRGKRAACQDQRSVFGLIPAHAGKTTSIWVHGAVMSAHPRSRGENSSRLTFPSETIGSSPLTRGKRRCSYRGGESHGLIPAHAGKTHCLHPCSPTGTAHPRSRGENPD